jgi:hypothetical protein
MLIRPLAPEEVAERLVDLILARSRWASKP